MTERPQPFVHLRMHSAYSLLEGALTIPKLVALAAAHEAPALALTDSNNLFGALEFSEAMAGAGIQPIVGCTLALTFTAEHEPGPGADPRGPKADGRIALLAKDETGYANLMRLSTSAYFRAAESGDPLITIGELWDHAEGLIALTGGPEGVIDPAFAEDNPELARSRLETLRAMFGDRLYVELQRHGLAHERAVEPHLVQLAYDMELPLVATNEPFFAATDDFEAHDALICIAQGSYVAVDERRRLSPEHYFKSADEMRALFADLPEALANTVEIAQRCAYRPEQRDPILPPFLTGGEATSALAETEAAELRRQAEAGLQERIAQHGTAPGEDAASYAKRLAFELDVITGMNYQGYFLIVADFIKWTKGQGIPVGPGRGSGAGSLVAYALTITDLDPIRFGLLFERFLNPERVSMPDFDIDFCQDRRDEVIAYVRERYGADRVAHIITFGKLQARAVLRDVGRVLQMPYGQVDRLCKLVPMNPANPVTLPQAIAGEPRLQEERDKDPIVAKLLDIGQRLEGLYRHASTHAAGVVIADRPLIDLVPLYRDARAQLPATQFNMKWAEAAGLVKFDFLGLKTLTVIDTARQLIARDGPDIDPAKIPLDDAMSYELMQRGDTVGVFQLEGQGMRDALRKLKPDRFEDIIAIVALYRPGPMDNIDTYVNRKHGREEIETLHPSIEPILAETYGVIIYQEQVMQIAQVLSGYSLGEADLLRRAMGKKIKKEMDGAAKSRFVEGAIANGVNKGRAEYIFELVAKFAGYGFNKSHAAAYALIAYQTAYLKANYPAEFVAASMTLDMGNADKLNGFAQEASTPRHSLGAAVGQSLRSRLHPQWRRHPLFPGGAEECRPAGGRSYLRRAAGEGAFPRHVRLRPPDQPAPRQQARARDAGGRGRLRGARRRPGHGPRQCRSDRRRRQPRPGDDAPKARRICSPAPATPRRPSNCAPPSLGCSPTSFRGSSRLSASSSPAIRSTTTRTPWRASAPRPGPSSPPRRKPAGWWAPWPARCCPPGSARARPAILTPSSPSLIRRASSRQWSSPRRSWPRGPCWSPAPPCCFEVEAEAEGETVRVRVQSLSSLDKAAEARHAGMKVYVEDPRALAPLAEQLGAKGGDGAVPPRAPSGGAVERGGIRAAARHRHHATAEERTQARRRRGLDQRALRKPREACPFSGFSALAKVRPHPYNPPISHAGR